MKSSSLGARLFEGLVQPILGSLWNSPPAAVEKKTDDTSSLSKSNRKTHIQGRIISSAQHPTSSYAETSAVRGSGLHQRDLSSENVAITVTGHKNASRRHQEQAATRPLSSGNRLINTVALGEIPGGTPPTAQGRLRGRKQTRVLQRFTSRRSNENTQGLIKETPDAAVPAAATAEAATAIAGGSRTRCVIRHRVADAVPGVSVNVLKSQRVRQQKSGDKRRKSAVLTQASSSSSVVPSEKQQCTNGKQNLSFVEAKDSQGSSSSINAMLYETAAARANDVTNTKKKWNPLPQRSNGGDNVIETFSRLNNRNHSKNSGPGSSSSSYLTERNDIRACTKCNCGSSDCNNSNSSSSSAWGNSSSDECVFTAGNSNVSFGESSGPAADTHRNVQVWLNTRNPCSSGQQKPKQQGLEEQQHGCLKHQIHHVQADHSTLKCATTSVGEEDSRETRLHLWQSAASSPDCNAAVSAAVPKEKSCSGGPCPQCSDTTTTCSSSSMTSCGDARDTATTGSAATMLEHPQQHYLDIDEQMPLAFLTSTAEDHTLGHNEEAAPLLPCAQNDSHQVVVASTQYSSSLGGGAAASSSGTSCIDLATDLSSSPPLSSLTSASSGCKYTAAASRHLENKILGVTNTSLPSCVVSSSHAHQKEEAAAAGKQLAGDNNIEECCIPVSNTKGHQQQCHHLQNSAGAAAAPAAASMMNVAVAGHQDDNAATVFVSAKEACVSDRLEQLQNEQQQQQQPSNPTEGGASVGSVIFGHRVLKPLRSKSLEENYDALVEIVAFTKRRCERETMELLRKDVHILYYARGLHHAAHVETYMQQQQNQKEKQQQGSSIASRNNSNSNNATLKLHSGEGGMSATSGSGLYVGSENLKSSSDGAAASSAAVMNAATSSPSTEKKNLTTPCFPSVSAALANGARPRPVPDWATPEALKKAMKQQQCYDPFSIFGEAPPELLLSEVYDEQHYTHISPQTRASHPVLARLKQQRRVALMTVFQQKRIALARAHHMLEQELAQLQQQQQQQQQRSSMSHETFSSMLGRVVLSCGSGIQTSTTIGGAAVKTENIMNRKCSSNNGSLSSFLQLKNTQDKENKNIKEKEAMLRLQQREILIQQQLLERRVEEQLQQEEKIHNEVLRNGFRFTGAARSNGGGGGECGAILFKKRVLPALEAWWRQQCQVELDWRNDPLTSEECSWYREVMHAAVDASDIISVQQACFCPTPPPYRQWTWTDCRVRQRKQHEQNLAKQQLLLQQQQQQQRQQQLLLQQQEQSRRGGGHDVHRAIEWGDEQSDDGEKKEMTCVVDRCITAADGGDGDNEATNGVAADYKKRYPEEIITAGMLSRCKNSQETAEDSNCDDESMSSSPEEKKRNGQLLAVRTPCSRRGRKRRAEEGDHNTTPQALVENNKIEETHHGSDERDIATTNNSGSARKRPRSFCRQAKKIQFHHHAQTDQSLNLQNVKECFSSRSCACDGCLSKDNLPKQRCCHNSLRRTKSKTLFSRSASIAAAAAGPAAAGGAEAAADTCSHTSNIESSGSKATAVILPQSFCHLNEQRSSDIYSNGSGETCNNVSNRGSSRSGFFSPHQARLGGNSGGVAISTPVAKMQALKLSNQQRFLSTAPLQHTQQRDKAVDRGQQPLQCSVMVVPPSHKATEFCRVTSLHEQAFVSPSPVTSETNTAADHLPSNWTGNGTPDTAGRSACDIKTGTPNSMGVAAAAVAAAAAAGVCCGGGAGGEHSNIATRGGPLDECSSTSIENRCRSGGKHMKQQIKVNTSQRFTRQLQKHIMRSAAARAATQESCLSTYNAGASGSLVSSAGTHSRLGIGGVREVSKRKSVRTDQAVITGMTSKNICIKENATSKNLYLSSKNHVRPTTLLTTRCARLSIDRVYGHRRTSDLFHNRSRSQYVLSSLGRPDITSAIHSTDERGGIAMDSTCKKDIECMNNEVP